MLRVRTCAAMALLLLTSLPLLSGGRRPAAQEPSSPPNFEDALTIEEARLAASDEFYLELALSEHEVRLCHTGATLAVYPFDDLSVSRPRLFFIPRGRHLPWVGQTWGDGRLVPPRVINRVRIVPGDESTIPTPDAPGVIPPSMDELIAVPRVFKVRFARGQILLVSLKGDIPGAVMPFSGWKGHWEDFLEGLGLKPADHLRVRMSMHAKDGAALFRSFPDKPPELLVLP